MLRLAGCSSGRRDCARGVGLRERGGSRAGLCLSCAGRAILSECRVFVRAHHAFLSECHVFVRVSYTLLYKCLAFGSRLLFATWRQTGRLALCSVPLPPWVEIAIRTFSNRRCGYPALLVHFEIARFLAAIPTRDEGTRGTENGVGGAAWVRFCVNALALLCFPRGVRWGKRWKPHCGRAPDCAKETRLPGLSSCDSRCGCVLRGEGHSGATKTRPAPISGGRTAAGRTGRAVYD